MLTSHWVTSSSAAKAYYAVTDYYAAVQGDWIGDGAKMLGLEGTARKEDFHALCDNLNPLTGESLTKYTREGRRVGLDLTFSSQKYVGIIRELAGDDNRGDAMVEDMHREAVAYALEYVERDMQARVRTEGKSDRLKDNRTTGNMVAHRVTHRDTRINGDDSMPDMSLHDHVFVFNATYDTVEDKWKAAELGQVKQTAPLYEAIYHNRMASNLKAMGYGIRREGKGFAVEGVSHDLVDKFSRRRKYIEAVAEKLGITSGKGFGTLGATTRLGKAKELADDLNAYWKSKLTDSERSALQGLKGKPSRECSVQEAAAYAIAHEFERKSVVDPRKLYETAIRHGMGCVTPEGVQTELKRQGMLLKDGKATTRDVLAQEGRIIAFAREGKGTMRPLVNREELDKPKLATLSTEQQAAISHVWGSKDRVMLVQGLAGVGKTTAQKAAAQGIEAAGKKVIALAQSADASRGVLRKAGFKDADTIARFLTDEKFQELARNQVIFIDEGSLVGTKTMLSVFDTAAKLNARVALWGDAKQHGSIERGAVLHALEQHAGLPVPKMTQIIRQKGRYKDAVESIAKGDVLGGFDILNDLEWVKQTPVFDHNKPLVDDYMEGVKRKKSMLVVAPTHVEGDEITAEIRKRLKQEGIAGQDEVTLDTLKPVGWTDAEKGDLKRYGSEVLQFHRNSGAFKAGQRITANRLTDPKTKLRPEHFSVYSPSTLYVAVGDTLRATGNGWNVEGKDRKRGTHRINNGDLMTVVGFDNGDLKVQSGKSTFLVSKDYGQLAHGYVATSYASQGKTVDRVLIAMGHESLPAVNAAQFYVSASRGKESARIYTDLNPTTLREAIQKSDPRMSATELMGPKPVKAMPLPKKKLRDFLRSARDRLMNLRRSERPSNPVRETPDRELGHSR